MIFAVCCPHPASVVRIMTRWIIGLALACALVLPVAAGRDNQSNLCPQPIPTGERMDSKTETLAWRTAKRLVNAPKSWKRPGFVIRHDDFYYDENGDSYGGFYHEPQPFFDLAGTGLVVSCEYIEIYLPLDSPDAMVHHVLTHEYLHALAGRIMAVHSQAGEEMEGCTPQDWFNSGCEEWVQQQLPHKENWE